MPIKRKLTPYIFIAPMVIVVTAVVIIPIITTGWMSFHDWYMARPGSHPFIGLENYLSNLSHKYFIRSVKTTTIYIAVTVLFRFIIGLGIALLLNQKFKGRGVVRSIVVIPWALPVVVVCLLWIQMLDIRYGIVNYLLQSIGLIKEPLQFLSSTSLGLSTAMVVNIWKGTPFVAIMLLAGLQSISGDIYEAAKIDGSSLWQSFRHITLPLLKPVSLIVFLLLAIWTLKDFAIVYVLTGGGPAHSTEVLTVYIYHTAFKGLRMGEASSAGVFLLITALIFTIIYMRLLGREEGAY